MPMRDDCKHYETRTYASGEVVRMCRLDLAPEAPWRCPAECSGYVRRIVDVGFTVGTLAHKPPPAEPAPHADVAGVLDQAEDIINAVGPRVLAEVKAQRSAGEVPRWRRWFRRRNRSR